VRQNEPERRSVLTDAGAAPSTPRWLGLSRVFVAMSRVIDAADALAADVHARCEFLADLFQHAPPELAEQALGPFTAKVHQLREMFVAALTVEKPAV
jgi:hypothetical protein